MISVFAQPSATFDEGRMSVQNGEDSIAIPVPLRRSFVRFKALVFLP